MFGEPPRIRLNITTLSTGRSMRATARKLFNQGAFETLQDWPGRMTLRSTIFYNSTPKRTGAVNRQSLAHRRRSIRIAYPARPAIFALQSALSHVVPHKRHRRRLRSANNATGTPERRHHPAQPKRDSTTFRYNTQHILRLLSAKNSLTGIFVRKRRHDVYCATCSIGTALRLPILTKQREPWLDRPAWEFGSPLANPCQYSTYVLFFGQERGLQAVDRLTNSP